jgi:hypothetical protein
MHATRTHATVVSLRPATELRRAWLDPAFAALYPDLPSGIWMNRLECFQPYGVRCPELGASMAR